MLDSGRFLPTQAEMLDSHSKVVRKFGCFPLNLRAGGVLECFMRPVPMRLHEPLLSLALPHSRLTNIPLITLSYEALTGRVLFGVSTGWMKIETRARACFSQVVTTRMCVLRPTCLTRICCGRPIPCFDAV